MHCVFANSLPLSELPGFDKENVTMYNVNIHKEQGQMLQFWVYLFLQFKNWGEDQLQKNREAEKEDQVLCEIVLKLLQMLYALNILKTVLKAFIDCTEYSLFFLNQPPSFFLFIFLIYMYFYIKLCPVFKQSAGLFVKTCNIP